MDNIEKIKFLKSKLVEIKKYENNLSDENIWEFHSFKEELLKALDDNEKFKFNQINFYEIPREPTHKSEPDDLPF
jgi:hypothetical protein